MNLKALILTHFCNLKSGMAGITHRIRFYVLGVHVVLLADSTNDWAGGNEDDGNLQHFGVESETESDSPTEDNSVLVGEVGPLVSEGEASKGGEVSNII
jgi:hypothetical protein